jgi:RHS repeat-associated protein
MLTRSSGYSSGSWSTHHAYPADGGGNITAMVNTSQALSANYRYDAFGNLISSSGSMASANTYRLSSKEWMPDAALYYYGYRFYSPNYQRWINQDPIGEEGGINLYGFVLNDPLLYLDPLGLSRGMCFADALFNGILGAAVPALGFVPISLTPFQAFEKAMGSGRKESSWRDWVDTSALDIFNSASAGGLELGKRKAERDLENMLENDRDMDLRTRDGYRDKTDRQKRKIDDRLNRKLNPLLDKLGKWRKASDWIPVAGDVIGAAADVYDCMNK